MADDVPRLVALTCPHCHQKGLFNLAQGTYPSCPHCGQSLKFKSKYLSFLLVTAGVVALFIFFTVRGPRDKHFGNVVVFSSKVEVEPHSTFWSSFEVARPGEAHLYIENPTGPAGYLIEFVSWQAPTQKDLDPLRDRQRRLKIRESGEMTLPVEKGKRYGFFVINEGDERIEAHVTVRLVERLD